MNTPQRRIDRYWLRLITIIVITAFLSQNIIWARPAFQQDTLASTSELTKPDSGIYIGWIQKYFIEKITAWDAKTIPALYNLFLNNTDNIRSDLDLGDINIIINPDKDKIELISPYFTLIFSDKKRFPEELPYHEISATNIRMYLRRHTHLLAPSSEPQIPHVEISEIPERSLPEDDFIKGTLERIKQNKPKVVVFYNKHYPLEPLGDVVEVIRGHYPPSQILFIEFPHAYSPLGYALSSYQYLYSAAQDMAKGKHILKDYNPEDNKKFGDALLRFIMEVENRREEISRLHEHGFKTDKGKARRLIMKALDNVIPEIANALDIDFNSMLCALARYNPAVSDSEELIIKKFAEQYPNLHFISLHGFLEIVNQFEHGFPYNSIHGTRKASQYHIPVTKKVQGISSYSKWEYVRSSFLSDFLRSRIDPPYFDDNISYTQFELPISQYPEESLPIASDELIKAVIGSYLLQDPDFSTADDNVRYGDMDYFRITPLKPEFRDSIAGDLKEYLDLFLQQIEEIPVIMEEELPRGVEIPIEEAIEMLKQLDEGTIDIPLPYVEGFEQFEDGLLEILELGTFIQILSTYIDTLSPMYKITTFRRKDGGLYIIKAEHSPSGIDASRDSGHDKEGRLSKIAYILPDSEKTGTLYLNITNRCTNNCHFCLKNLPEAFPVDLDLKGNAPTEREIKRAIKSRGGLSQFQEVVFCGLGEPLLRLDVIKIISKWIKNLYPNIKIRINTNGQANLVYTRNIVPELKGLADSINISLNAEDSQKYQALCNPIYGKRAYPAILEFTRECKDIGLDVILSVVDGLPPELGPSINIEECRMIADHLGVSFRVRGFIPGKRQQVPTVYDFGDKESFEDMLSSSQKLQEYISNGRILKLVPEWKDWIALYKNENFKQYHPLSPEEHILTVFRQLESEYFQKMIRKGRFKESDLNSLRRALFFHDFGKIQVLREDPAYSKEAQAGHPEKSAVMARDRLFSLGYTSKEIEMDLRLIKYHSVLADLARYGSSQIGLLEFVTSIRSIRSLNLISLLQLIDAASVRPRFEDSLSVGLERRINEITELIQMILTTKDEDRKKRGERYLDYLKDIQRQNDEVVDAFIKFKEILKSKNININDGTLQEAFLAMHRSHLGQLRDDDHTPFVIHCIETAIILVDEFGIRDPEWIIAALLHDVLEDTRTTPGALEEIFGKNIVSMVTLLSKPDEKGYPSKYKRERDYMHKMIYGTDEIKDRDILTGAQTIKCGDRIHCLRTLKTKVEGFPKKKIDETYEIFIPYFIGETEVRIDIKRLLIKELIKSGTEWGILSPIQVSMLELLSKEIINFKIPELKILTSPFNFVKGLVEYMQKAHHGIPPVLAFCGMSGVGKSTFTDKLKDYLEMSGKKVAVFDARDFLTPRVFRDKILDEARSAQQTFYEQREKLYDFTRFRKEVLDRIREFRASEEPYIEFKLSNIYNELTRELTAEKTYRIDRDTVILIEGIHVLQEEFLPVYDATFLVYAPAEVCLLNVLARETLKPVKYRQSYRKIRDRFKLLDWPSYRKHWIEYWLTSGFIIDNTDYRSPTLKRNPFPSFPDKAPWIPEEFINPEKQAQRNLEKIFLQLKEKEIDAEKIVSESTNVINTLRNLLAVKGIDKLLPRGIALPLADAGIETLDLFLDQIIAPGNTESINIFFRLLTAYLLEEAPDLRPVEEIVSLSIENPEHITLLKAIFEKVTKRRRLFPLPTAISWQGDSEIPVLLDIDSIKEDPSRTLTIITRLGLNLLPNQRLHIILTHSQMTKSGAKKIFKPFYKTINLGKRDTKKAKIWVSFELDDSGKTKSDFFEYLSGRLRNQGINLDKVFLITTERNYQDIYQALNTGYQLKIRGPSEIFREKVSSLITATRDLIDLEMREKQEEARRAIIETLKKCMADSNQGSLTQSMAWHILEGLGINEGFKGKVIYSLNTFLDSRLNDGNGLERLKDLVKHTKGRVFFYAGEGYIIDPDYAFLKEAIVTKDSIADKIASNEIAVFMLNQEHRISLGINEKTLGRLVGSQFVIPVEKQRDIENDILLGLEILRTEGMADNLPSLFKLLLIEAIREYLESSGIVPTPERIQEILRIDMPKHYLDYLKDIEESAKFIEKIITSA